MFVWGTEKKDVEHVLAEEMVSLGFDWGGRALNSLCKYCEQNDNCQRAVSHQLLQHFRQVSIDQQRGPGDCVTRKY